jgi:hypothetical protein
LAEFKRGDFRNHKKKSKKVCILQSHASEELKHLIDKYCAKNNVTIKNLIMTSICDKLIKKEHVKNWVKYIELK